MCDQLGVVISREGGSIPVVEVMDHVRGIEQLCDSSVDEFPSLLQSILAGGGLGFVYEVELEIFSAVWSIIGEVFVFTLPIFMSEDIVTPGDSGVTNQRTAYNTGVGREWVVGDG